MECSCKSSLLLSTTPGRLAIYTAHSSLSFTYDHRTLRTELPVRSAELKQCTGGLVVRWVTTGEYPLLYVFVFFACEEGFKKRAYCGWWACRCLFGRAWVLVGRSGGEGGGKRLELGIALCGARRWIVDYVQCVRSVRSLLSSGIGVRGYKSSLCLVCRSYVVALWLVVAFHEFGARYRDVDAAECIS
jgi:hypothetical protein